MSSEVEKAQQFVDRHFPAIARFLADEPSEVEKAQQFVDRHFPAIAKLLAGASSPDRLQASEAPRRHSQGVTS